MAFRNFVISELRNLPCYPAWTEDGVRRHCHRPAPRGRLSWEPLLHSSIGKREKQVSEVVVLRNSEIQKLQ